MPGTVLYEKRDRVAYVTLNRPESLNAFNHEMMQDLLAVWEDYNADDNLWVAILSGTGRAFCSGADIKAGRVGGPERHIPTLAFGPIEVLKPIICAIHGYCLGEGFTTALACDIRVAADDARIGYPHPSHGFMTIGGNVRLPRMTFPGWARYLVLTAEVIGPDEAHRLGLVHHVVPRAELLDKANELAERVLQNSPLALWYSKEAQERGLRMSFPEAVAYARHMAVKLSQSEDLQEGVRAFIDKRHPVWKGR
ncbi:MAG: enoyl-CoA hydratase/isomerase family protein [Chloroflexi bacterium]|nr:enoyl-CoA hydratase/isomerase family protein [Chloroflexota bacterium]